MVTVDEQHKITVNGNTVTKQNIIYSKKISLYDHIKKSTKSVNILRRTRVLFIIHICKFLTEVVCLHRGQGSMTAYKINIKASLGVSSPGGSTN